MKKSTPPSTSCMSLESLEHMKPVSAASSQTASPKKKRARTQFVKFISPKKKSIEIKYPSYTPEEGNPCTTERERAIIPLQQDLLFKAYVKDILYWSKVFYGDHSVLHKEMEEILKNPEAGGKILQKITTSPKSIHAMAGRKILGIKTRARKNAEKAFKPLCSALQSYIRLVENANDFPYRRPYHHKQPIEKGAKTEGLESSLHPKKEIEPHAREKTTSS
ncbi:BID domain-containing T4SS effector, partial [Bartonella phoceensis]|uniref:BID domain-containing T4SS effector n=1 Tax=Bartonella phoceensis TaxID=270249 RepID=UPI001ABB541C